MFLRLWCRAPGSTIAGARLGAGGPAVRRDRDRRLAAQVAGRSATSVGGLDLRGVPGRGDLAAELAGAGAEVEQVVGRRDHLAVVLDQDQRVAQVAEVLAAPPSSRALSRGCRPIVGSSSTYSTPVRPLPIWLARRMRWALAAGERRACRGRASGSRARRRPGTCRRSRISRTQVAGDLLLVARRASAP